MKRLNYKTKSVIKEITKDEIIASWLKSEWYKDCYKSKRNISTNKIVSFPDITNSSENVMRESLLRIHRGKSWIGFQMILPGI